MSVGAWKTVYDSVRGTSHSGTGLPCQDACRVIVESIPDGELLLITCADGAGSAKHADQGSLVACDRLLQQMLDTVRQNGDLMSVTRLQALSWVDAVRAELITVAESLYVGLRELATTLMGCVLSAEAALFLQIGDGSMVVRRKDQFEPVFWPQSGEFANTTNFVTDTRFEGSIEFSVVGERIDECAVFTDGLERLILNFSARNVHVPFLEPMLGALRRTNTPTEYFEPLRLFLNSPKVNERTDDDKTLILATRLDHANSIL